MERPWTTVGQPKPCETSTRAVVREGPWWLKAGRRAGFEGLRQTSHSAGHWRFLPLFFFLWLLVQFFFSTPPCLAEDPNICHKLTEGSTLAVRERFNLRECECRACIGGSVVEFSPATREARVQFPANAFSFFFFFYHFFYVHTGIYFCWFSLREL